MGDPPTSEGKRITLKRSRPNPIFEDWLSELYEEARAKKSKLESMLKEALTSLSKYPLPLETGAECGVLKGFDKNLCTFLDRRLEVYNSQKRHSSVSNKTTINSGQIIQPQTTRRNRTKENGCTNVGTANAVTNTRSSVVILHEDSDSQASTRSVSSNDMHPERNSKGPLEKHPRKYKLQFGSGGYAILIALVEYKMMCPNDPPMNKEQLISRAQPHSEESFVRPRPSSYYTAWANMGTLIKKGLVLHLRGKKSHYTLTDEGFALAKELKATQKSIPTLNDIVFSCKNMLDSASAESSDGYIYSLTPPQVSNGNISSSSSSQLLNGNTNNPETIVVLSEDSNSSSDTMPYTPTSTNVVPTAANVMATTATVTATAATVTATAATVTATAATVMATAATVTATAATVTAKKAIATATATNAGATTTNIVPPTANAVPTADSQGNFIELPTNSFDVILLIDKQETGGVSKKNDPTVAQFNKYPSLKHEYRSLKVGDFTWVARHKVHTDQELVLPWIIERKRMDDLGASIKDGRFHEQKFRLRKCGLDNVIYLIENYGSNKHVGLPIRSLKQAIANTRVQDEFKVHITDSHTNSARFLAILTKRLTVEYQSTNLIGCHRQPQSGELMTFSYFNKSSSKNKPLTVTETFIKLLLQLKGVSVEKALAITNVYRTPSALMKEYERHTHNAAEKLLANIKFGSLGRNLGPVVSKSIYHLFVNKKLPSDEDSTLRKTATGDNDIVIIDIEPPAPAPLGAEPILTAPFSAAAAAEPIISPSHQTSDSDHKFPPVAVSTSTTTESNSRGELYAELMALESHALLRNTDPFECGVCMADCGPGDGVVLRDCVHSFCAPCLGDLIRHSSSPPVGCPAAGCGGALREREVRALVPPREHGAWLARGLARAESGAGGQGAFHCRTPDCAGWALCDPERRTFVCPVCMCHNCVPCKAIHENETCEQHLAKGAASERDKAGAAKTQELLSRMIAHGAALPCPQCGALLTKASGCDWVMCAACRTELCWATGGRRWGRGGRGDTSGGCRCRVGGKRCHPKCRDCH